MPGLISSAEAASIRDALSVFRVHTATITPMVAGSPDAENNVTYAPGTPVTGVACKYRAEDRVRVEETGQTLVSVPTITLAHDQAIAVGSRVSNVQNSEGVVLFVGPAVVDYIVPSAGLGPTLKKKAVLRFGDVTV